MKRKVTIEYGWKSENNPIIKPKHQEALEEAAMERIVGMMSEGFTSGELSDNVRMDESDGEDGISYTGWWSMTTENTSNEITVADKIGYIKKVVSENGPINPLELNNPTAPCISCVGDNSVTVESFNEHDVDTITYIGSMSVGDSSMSYEELPEEIIDEIFSLVQDYEAEMEQTMKRCED